MVTPPPPPADGVRSAGSVGAVVFDLGNVLIPWDRRLLFRKLIDDPARLDHFCDHVLTMEVNAELDRGTPIQEVVDERKAHHPDHAELLQAFADRWIETTGPAIEGSVELLRRLKAAAVPCYALSNWGRDTFLLAEPHHPFLQWFDGRIISGFEGVVKPDDAIFELLCERFSLDPAHTLFIDDAPANIAAAERLGFATHHFTDPETLAADLTHRHLL